MRLQANVCNARARNAVVKERTGAEAPNVIQRFQERQQIRAIPDILGQIIRVQRPNPHSPLGFVKQNQPFRLVGWTIKGLYFV